MPASNWPNRRLRREPVKDAIPGRSMRQQAFMAFDLGMRPSEVTTMLGIKDSTAYRYFQQWKKLPRLSSTKYKLARIFFRKLDQDDRRAIARILASQLRTSEEEVLAQMRKPWAIRQIVTGEWKQWPVQVTHTRTGGILKRGIQEMLLSVRHPKEAKYILEMAINQNINPVDTHGQSPWHFTGQASLDLNPGVLGIQRTSISSLLLSQLWIQSSLATIPHFPANIFYQATQTFSLVRCSLYLLFYQQPYSPHTLAVLSSPCVYGQAVCCT